MRLVTIAVSRIYLDPVTAETIGGKDGSQKVSPHTLCAYGEGVEAVNRHIYVQGQGLKEICWFVPLHCSVLS